MINCSEKDWLKLSGYLDGSLPGGQTDDLELRLSNEPDLADALVQLRKVRALLSQLPQKPVPHNFILTENSVRLKRSKPVFPIFRLATAISSILFIISFGLKFFVAPIQNNQPVMSALSVEPKKVISTEETTPPLAAPLFDAGGLREALPTQVLSQDEEIIDEPSTVVSTNSAIPWGTILWILGILTFLFGLVAIIFYFQERV